MGDKKEHTGPVKVTVTDPATGEVLQEKTFSDDYMIITAGNRYVKSWQVWGSTHQVNIARAKPGQTMVEP